MEPVMISGIRYLDTNAGHSTLVLFNLGSYITVQSGGT